MANNRQGKVLVVPDGSLYLAFRLLPILRQAGLSVDVLCLRRDLIAHSRYVETVLVEESLDALFHRLAGLLRQTDRPWRAVIVADERLVRRLVATDDAELLNRWQPSALDPLVRGFLLGKFGLDEVQDRWQLPIPRCHVCHAPAQIQAFGESVGWPIMVKPPDLSGGTGVLRLNSPGEVEPLRLRLPVLAQKHISGRRGLVDMICSGGRPLAWLTSYSTRRAGGEFGPSTARLFMPMPRLTPLVESIARLTRFEGFCGFDWIEEDGTGQHYLIEFHPRPPSGFRFGRFCGVDFSTGVSGWLNGMADNSSPLVQKEGPAVPAHYFSDDLSRCLRERDWPGLKAWLPGSGTCHDVYWDDLPLLMAWAINRLCASLRPGSKKRRTSATASRTWSPLLPPPTPASSSHRVEASGKAEPSSGQNSESEKPLRRVA